MKNREETKPEKEGPPELMPVMMKIVERLEALEGKMDRVLSQMSGDPLQKRECPKPAPSPATLPQTSRQADPSRRPDGGKPVRERRGRILHHAVCADCHKDCEIPFKPTGERPVYCKACFSKHKASNSSKASNENIQGPDLPSVPVAVASPQRQVSVTKKGVGKVTISEIIRPPASDSSSKGKNLKPAKKPRR